MLRFKDFFITLNTIEQWFSDHFPKDQIEIEACRKEYFSQADHLFFLHDLKPTRLELHLLTIRAFCVVASKASGAREEDSVFFPWIERIDNIGIGIVPHEMIQPEEESFVKEITKEQGAICSECTRDHGISTMIQVLCQDVKSELAILQIQMTGNN